MYTRFLLSPLLAVLTMSTPPAHAQDEMRTETVSFPAGQSSITLQDSITGYGSVLYEVPASAGQTLEVLLRTDHGATYFNVYGPGKGPGDEAIANASMTPDLNRYEGALTEGGTYSISVYMMRSAARRNETAPYTIDIAVQGGNAASTGQTSSEPVTTTERVQFQSGASGATLSGTLNPGDAANYLLGAAAEQFMVVELRPQGGSNLQYEIFVPGGDLLYESSAAGPVYRGQLYKSGDHTVTVFNLGDEPAGYDIAIEIE